MIPLKVGFLLTNSFTLSALSNFVDVLRLAADDGDRSRPISCRWFYMSSDGQPVRSSCGLAVTPDADLVDPAALDYVVVVGGLLHRGRQVDGASQAYLCKAATSSVGIVGLCTGSFVLCRLGLMRHRRCCISWYHYPDFIREFDALVPIADQLFVVDGNRITCSGGLGVAHLAAFLVDRHLGASRAQKALHILQIDKSRPGSSAQPAPPLDQDFRDDRVSRALVAMEQNLAVPLGTARLARLVGVGERQLSRVFMSRIGMTPRGAYLQLRLKHARWMLGTDRTLREIAADTGFVDAAHLGKAFKAAFGETPGVMRRAASDPVRGTSEARRMY